MDSWVVTVNTTCRAPRGTLGVPESGKVSHDRSELRLEERADALESQQENRGREPARSASLTEERRPHPEPSKTQLNCLASDSLASMPRDQQTEKDKLPTGISLCLSPVYGSLAWAAPGLTFTVSSALCSQTLL